MQFSLLKKMITITITIQLRMFQVVMIQHNLENFELFLGQGKSEKISKLYNF